MMRSSLAIVDKRWAMTSEVRFFIKLSKLSWINFSLSESRAEVASSSTRIGEFFKIARAIAIRWR